MCKKILLFILILSLPILIGVIIRDHIIHKDSDSGKNKKTLPPVGIFVDREHDIAVYSNSENSCISHSKYFAEDDSHVTSTSSMSSLSNVIAMLAANAT